MSEKIKIGFHTDFIRFSRKVTDFRNEVNVTKTYKKRKKSIQLLKLKKKIINITKWEL